MEWAAFTLGAMCIGVLVVARGRRARRTVTEAVDDEQGAPMSNVRVLTTETDLHEALLRAAQAERGIAEAVKARADRYEASIVPAKRSDRGSLTAMAGTVEPPEAGGLVA